MIRKLPILAVALALLCPAPASAYYAPVEGHELQCEGPTAAKPWQDWIDAECWPLP